MEGYINHSIDMEKKIDDGMVKWNKLLKRLIATQGHMFKNAQKRHKMIKIQIYYD